MGPLDQILHLINFCAPALAVGVLLALLARLFMKKPPLALGLLAHTAINCVAGVLALAVGLWFFGNDGKMASYAAMVVVIGTCQWWGTRGRR